MARIAVLLALLAGCGSAEPAADAAARTSELQACSSAATVDPVPALSCLEDLALPDDPCEAPEGAALARMPGGCLSIVVAKTRCGPVGAVRHSLSGLAVLLDGRELRCAGPASSRVCPFAGDAIPDLRLEPCHPSPGDRITTIEQRRGQTVVKSVQIDGP